MRRAHAARAADGPRGSRSRRLASRHVGGSDPGLGTSGAFEIRLELGWCEPARGSGTGSLAARRAGRGDRDGRPCAGDRRAPRRRAAPHPHHHLSRAGALLPGRLRAGRRAGHRQPRRAACRLDLRKSRRHGAGIGQRSPVAGHEPGPARQIRRGGRARSRGDPARRADAACVHRRCGLLRRGHAPTPQGRLGEGALRGRAVDRGGADGERRPPSPPGCRLLRVGSEKTG